MINVDVENLPADPETKKLISKVLVDDANFSRDFFDKLSEHERQYVVKTLSGIADNDFGSFNRLWEVDFEHRIPSVEEFLFSDYYMGAITAPKEDPGIGLYDAWKHELVHVLNPDNKVLEVLVQSSIGCFTGETKISLLDGTERRLDSFSKGDKFFVYGCKSDGTILPVEATALGETKKVSELIEVTLDNGISERCTPDHLWQLRDGTYKRADQLASGDSLMPLYRRLSENKDHTSGDQSGYEMFLDNSTLKYKFTHSEVAYQCLDGKIAECWKDIKENNKPDKFLVVHHIDFNKHNNDPSNLQWMGEHDHWMLHSSMVDKMPNWKPQPINHKVVSTRRIVLEEAISVYDIEVVATSNFALSSGTFVHNSGKTTFALLALCWWLMKLLNMRNPQRYYGLMPQTRLVLFIFNITLELAYDVCYLQLSQMLNLSPFFKEHLQSTKAKDAIVLPKNIAIDIGSRLSHSVGQAVIYGLLDEANLGVDTSRAVSPSARRYNFTPDDQGMSTVMKAYNGMLSRMQSRFMRSGGSIDGQIYMVSSQSYKNAALNKHIEETRRKNIKTSYVIEKTIYDVKSMCRGKKTGLYSGETFRVLVGDQFMDSRILGEAETVPSGHAVLNPPVEYLERFQKDLPLAMRDVCNVGGDPTNKLIRNKERLRECIDPTRRSPFNAEVVYLDFDGKDEVKDFLDLAWFKMYLSMLPPNSRFVFHSDNALNGDALGIALSHTTGAIDVVETDITGIKTTEKRLVFTNDFALRIKNVEGKEIPLFKIVRFVMFLVRELGINISLASCDGYQKSALLQLLKAQQIECKEVSVDRDDVPYIIFKSAVYDGRVSLYPYTILVDELFELIHYSLQRKVDHPENGSKDVADAVAATVYSLSQMHVAEIEDTVQAQDVMISYKDLMKEIRKRTANNDEDLSWVTRD